MIETTNNALLLSLANLLHGNHVEKASLESALELICNAAPFDCGVVYEMDFAGEFCLMGSYSIKSASVSEPTYLKDFILKHKQIISEKKAMYIEKYNDNSAFELELLNYYHASSLLISFICDEKDSVYGVIVLHADKIEKPHSEAHKNMIVAGISMLERYIGIRMYQSKLIQAQTTMESILDNTGIDIYVNDFNSHDILYVNKSMAAPYGGREKFMGQKCWKVLFPGQQGPCEFCPQHQLIDEQGKPTKVYTWDYQRPFDGSWFRVFSAAFKWIDGRLAHVVSSADITDNKRNEALVETLANYDMLTNLPNRRMLMKECELRIGNATSTEQGYILFFDIDGFKLINDNFGHDAGDEFLIQLGKFFSSIPLLKNAIYRNGGDEFVGVVGGEMITKENIQSLANFIHERFKKPWILKKGKVFCSTSIGVACYPEDGTTADELLQKADMAMYKAKKAGGARLCFGYQLKEKVI